METNFVTNYETLRTVLRARRIALGMSQLDLDERAGLQNGYTGKIEAGIRNFGATSLPSMLGALGMVLMPMLSSAKHEENACAAWLSGKSAQKDQKKKWGAKGGRKRSYTLTREQRKRIAMKAAKARWDRFRADKAKTERERRPRGSAPPVLNPA